MRSIAAVFRRELGATLGSPIAWVTCLLFVGLLHGAWFLLGYPLGDLRLPAFWAGRIASLDALVAWIPPFFAILAPALTMGAWAEERRLGTDELLLTQPVSVGKLVLGKFAAGWVLMGSIATVAILPAALVADLVGPLDRGTVVGVLVGVWMLAAVCISIGQLASALTREDLVAFLVSAVFLLLLWSASLFVRVLPVSFAEALWYASPSLHFLETAARGVLDLRDLVYFGLFTLAALTMTGIVLEGRRWR
jgi:ABC-2 type transport system permease protein